VLGEVEASERYVSANTFSKTWTMTGWRLGWLVGPPEFITQVGKLIEFNTSCAPPFVQRAGVVAVERGDELAAATVARLARLRDRLVGQLSALPGVELAPPPGAMYAFFRLPGVSDDSLACAKRLVAEAGLGLAPGMAFGPEGEGYLRWCFAASEERLEEGVRRLARFVGA
jgi:aspartate/methionine/tyrosine aminotransferase